MRKLTYPWQNAVEMALRFTSRDSLSGEEKQGMLDFVTSCCDDDGDKACRLLDEMAAQSYAVPWGERIFLAVLILVPVALMGVFGAAQQTVMELIWLLGRGLLLISGLALLNPWAARRRRMRSYWKHRQPTREGTLEALQRMYYASLGSGLSAIGWLRSVLGVLALAGVIVLTIIPAPESSLVEQTRVCITGITQGEKTMEDALALLMQAEDGEVTAQLEKLCSMMPAGSDDRYLAVAASLRRIDESAMAAMSYPMGRLASHVDDVLANTQVREIDQPEEIAALPVLLKHGTEEQRDGLLKRFLSLSRVDAGVLAAFGSMQGLPVDVEALLAVCTEIAGAGHDALPYLQSALAGTTCAEAAAVVPTMADEGQRKLYLRACAPSITATDEVLAYIRLAGEYGVTPTQLYPDGAVLDWDTSALDPWNALAGKPSLNTSFLVVRRLEQPEVVASLQDLAELDADFCYDVEGHLNPQTQTVLLDTAALERIPPERVPQTLADCGLVVLADMQYHCDGHINSWRQMGSKTLNRYFPSYAACHVLVVFRMDDHSVLYAFDELIAFSPCYKQVDAGVEDLEDQTIEEVYLGTANDAWMDSAVDRFLDELEDCSWNFTTMNLKHLLN